MKVAFSHDWLNGMRGGEKCLESLLTSYPDSEIYTLLYEKGKLSPAIESRPIHTSFLQNLPGAKKHYKAFLPLFPQAIESMNVNGAELIISMNHCVAKGVSNKRQVPHICYCFTPMRYAWMFFDEYFGHYAKPMQAVIRGQLARLKKWDAQNASKVTHFIGISHHIRKRIEKFYDREAAVIYPPVDTEFYTPSQTPKKDFWLIVTALVPYKRADLAVQACMQRREKCLVVGSGPEAERLKTQANDCIEFLGWQSNEKIRELYRQCRGLIFPGEEDFGIVPVEAQACGAPVIAYGKGGALETIQPHKTGVFFDEQSPEALADALGEASKMTWNADDCVENAKRFSEPRFRKEFEAFAERVL